MKRILTGIQCTGRPHLGNVLGAMLPAITLSQKPDHEAFIFLADLHTLTTLKAAELRRQYVHETATAWLALGVDTEKVMFYRQSGIPAVCELTWYLSCFTPYPMLANAHAFKDKRDKLASVNGGLFIYPALMAADILLYQANSVPVGKDQLQHLEIARDVAVSFNSQYGPIFTIPEALIDMDIATIPGIDGQKMSKSYHNTVDIFLPEDELLQNIMRIQTDSLPLEAPKDPETCNVYKLYSALASDVDRATMRQQYRAGGYGYKAAKEALFELILERFKEPRKRFDYYINDVLGMHRILQVGEEHAKEVAEQTLVKVREKLGYA
jgi:tryptophanyl-tRNA synthetase